MNEPAGGNEGDDGDSGPGSGSGPCQREGEAGRFLALSAALTGFDAAELTGTGLAGTYRRLVRSRSDPALYEKLAATATDPYVPTGDAALDGLARAVCHLWYAGAWPDGPGGGPPAPVSARAHAGALVWRSFGAHPPGAGRPGPGSWAEPPSEPGGGEGL
ncbi:hypothetical protein [Streptomyces sp. NPDC001985]|uniref:hypothetical protein n=1 Tax=Streptomyces sp. NPDC001985 TaxID=3154406 RepID=UPI003321F543